MNVFYSKWYPKGIEINTKHVIFFTLILGAALSTKPNLRSPYIRDYDVIEYDHVHLRDHHVTKRSTALRFKFKAFGRTFSPILRQDNGHIYSEFMFETSKGHTKREPPLLYSGIIQEDGSKIQGVLKKKGHFEGRIRSHNETFYIESASQHFDDVTDFHTVIYKHSDVIVNTSQSFCAHSNLLKSHKKLIPDAANEKLGSYRYPEGKNEINDNNEFVFKRGRRKRAVDPSKKMCELYIEADHLFYQKFGSNEETVIEKLAEHVQALNAIFNEIDFDNSGKPDSIGFIIKKIKIWDDPTVDGYKYDGNFAVDYLLNLYSDGNFDDYCLSYLFTDRDFSDGVLGLAWLGDASTSVAGGVCETHKKFNGEGKSLNTGIVTFSNYGSDVPSLVSHSTFAHEVGHNFGSDHDPTGNVDCTPGDPNGNYIMYPLSTSGHKENNFKFSTCTINQVNPVIDVKARGEDGCFVESTVALCGNRIVEDGEECDCGWEEECLESCCNPQVNDTSLPGVETPCTLRSTSVCSPSEGPCCQENCQYANNSVVCRLASDCLNFAFCSGTSTVCPESEHVTNGSLCGGPDKHMVCYKGECTGDVCAAFGREQCYCKGTSVDDWKNELLCTLCCMDGGVCTPSDDLADIPTGKSLPGTPCNDFKGYCDVFDICRQVNPEGPLANLKNLLTGDALNAVKGFIEEHWYIGIIVGIAMFISILLVVKFCSISTKDNVRPLEKRDSITPSSTSSPTPASRHNQIAPQTYM